jgi:hypothetical protein
MNLLTDLAPLVLACREKRSIPRTTELGMRVRCRRAPHAFIRVLRSPRDELAILREGGVDPPALGAGSAGIILLGTCGEHP